MRKAIRFLAFFLFLSALFVIVIRGENLEKIEEKGKSSPRISVERDVIKEIAFLDKDKGGFFRLLIEGKASEALFESGKGKEFLSEVTGDFERKKTWGFAANSMEIAYDTQDINLENLILKEPEGGYVLETKHAVLKKEEAFFSGGIVIKSRENRLIADEGIVNFQDQSVTFYGNPFEYIGDTRRLLGKKLEIIFEDTHLQKIKSAVATGNAFFSSSLFSLASEFFSVAFGQDGCFESLTTSKKSLMKSFLKDSLWSMEAEGGYYLRGASLISLPGKVAGFWLGWEFEGDGISIFFEKSKHVEKMVLEGSVVLKDKGSAPRMIVCDKMIYSDTEIVFEGKDKRVLFLDGEFTLSAPKLVCMPNGSSFRGEGDVRCEFSENEWNRLKKDKWKR